jgi:hypothetical protein
MFFMIAGRLLGAVGLLSLALFATLSMFAAETPGLLWIAAGAGIGLASWVYLDWQMLRALFGSQGGRSQTASWLLIIVVTGILALLGYMAEKDPVRWDHSENKMHSLSEQGRGIIEQMSPDLGIEILAFYVSLGDRMQENQRQAFRSLTAAARSVRPGIQVELIDPETHPAQASKAQVTSNGTVLITVTPKSSDGIPRSERLSNPDEAALVNALLRLSSGDRPAIYTITGHGEAAITGQGPQGLNMLAQRLEALGFAVAELDTLREETIPDDARLLILAGPMVPLSAAEANSIEAWVNEGGALLVCSEPRLPGDGPERTGSTGLENALASWGMKAMNNMIFDEVMRRALGDATFPISERFAMHEITRELQLPLVLGTARSLALVEDNESGAQVSVLASTSEAAWGESRLEADSYSPDPEDELGPVILALTTELPSEGDSKKAGRVVLVGDRDWLSDGLIAEFGNLDFATRTIGHLTRRDEVIQIPPMGVTRGTLDMTFLQELFSILTAVLLIPGALILGAGVLWGWRKSL